MDFCMHSCFLVSIALSLESNKEKSVQLLTGHESRRLQQSAYCCVFTTDCVWCILLGTACCCKFVA